MCVCLVARLTVYKLIIYKHINMIIYKHACAVDFLIRVLHFRESCKKINNRTNILNDLFHANKYYTIKNKGSLSIVP